MSPHLRPLCSSRRHVDPTFEKLMSVYKHYLKVVSVRDLILSSSRHQDNNNNNNNNLLLSLPLSHLSHPSIYQRLNLNKGAPHFLRCFPHIFALRPDPTTLSPLISLTPAASGIAAQESAAAEEASDHCVVDRLIRILMMSQRRRVPMRAVFRVWRELGLPDDFEDRVLRGRRDLFRVRDNPSERNTHFIELEGDIHGNALVSKAEEWRRQRRISPHPNGRFSSNKVDELELRYGFKQEFPPGMRLTKNYRAKLKEWQRLPYVGPYEPFYCKESRSKDALKRMEKRAVGIVHEFLSLTVEKMAEVEQVSQFRKWFGIDLNIRDLFLDHPGIFYMSAKGNRHTVFLREAYQKGRLIEPNPIYDARMKLLQLVAMRRRGLVAMDDGTPTRTGMSVVEKVEDEEEEEDDGDKEKEEHC